MYTYKLLEIKNKNDIAHVAELAFEIWNQHYSSILSPCQIEYMLEKFQSASAIENQINEGYDYFFIQGDGAAVGYTSIKTVENDDLFISKLYIKKQHRKKGAGRFGLEKIFSIAKENHCSKVWLTVNKYNSGSHKAYEKLGFKNSGSRVTDIGSGYVMDDFVMVKEIEIES